MLTTLETYIRIKNAQNRPNARRAKIGPWYRQGRFSPYRKLALSIWELKGPASTWPAQLKQYYHRQPVFALVGGLAAGSWQPIHDFCERYRVPSIFPLTDRPVVSEQDWYTLYFSKGPYQEGAATARFLRGTNKLIATEKIIQISSNLPKSKEMAKGFRETREKLNQPAAEEIQIANDKRLDVMDAERLRQRFPNARFVVWLTADHIEFMQALVGKTEQTALIASASLLGEALQRFPEELRQATYFTYPERLPKDRELREVVVKKWLRVHKVPILDMDIQDKVYFIGWMLSGALQAMLDEYYQDYFLDVFDMMNDEYYSIINYPRVSFGQGQRYAAKGCYIVQLGTGTPAPLIPKTDWVIQ